MSARPHQAGNQGGTAGDAASCPYVDKGLFWHFAAESGLITIGAMDRNQLTLLSTNLEAGP
jgi:hypothetical protein